MKIWTTALLAVAALAVTAQAGTVTVRSGDGLSPTTTDPNITMLVGPNDTGFGAALTAADFTAADAGPNALVVLPNGLWKAHLDAPNASAEWLGTNRDARSGGATALYAMDVDLGPGPFSSVILDFHYLVDNVLGDDFNEGLFLNGSAVAGTKDLTVSLTNFQVDQALLGLDVTALVTPGVNRFYINAGDAGGPSGLQFAAVFTTTPAVPLPPAAWMGLGLLGLVGVGRRLRRRR